MRVRLIKAFSNPFHNAIATARTCYSSTGIIEEEKITAKHYPLADSVFQAGHHTVFGHAYFQFALEGVSRQFVWSFLHNHPHYNSEQVSQRYVEVRPGSVYVPELPSPEREIYLATVALQMDAYRRLTDKLIPVVTAKYLERFPHHDVNTKPVYDKIHKQALEVARYVLPVATTTYLYHTINALTLARYYRLCQQGECPSEQIAVVTAMVKEVLRVEPEYERIFHTPLSLEAFPEAQWFTQESKQDGHPSMEFEMEFDASLDGYTSKLVSAPSDNEEILAMAVRDVLGVSRLKLSDDEAIELVLNSAKNRLLSDTLNLTMMSKLGVAMNHPTYTFRKKLSHTADSQNQRHRTSYGTRPLLRAHRFEQPDYITPSIIWRDKACVKLYDETMGRIWTNIGHLCRRGVASEVLAYLLPNSVAVRLTETSSLASLYHKHKMRLCLLAQDEIWRISVEEAQQIRNLHPRIGKYLLPPCTHRWLAQVRPTCPEGKRFCGVPLWKIDINQYHNKH